MVVVTCEIPVEDEPNRAGLFGRVRGSVLEQASIIIRVMMMNQVYRVLFILIFLKLLKLIPDFHIQLVGKDLAGVLTIP